jgi:hypothetical protein
MHLYKNGKLKIQQTLESKIQLQNYDTGTMIRVNSFLISSIKKQFYSLNYKQGQCMCSVIPIMLLPLLPNNHNAGFQIYLPIHDILGFDCGPYSLQSLLGGALCQKTKESNFLELF